MPGDLSIIIVNWNVSELLRGCLASVLATGRLVGSADAPLVIAGRDTEVLVVDNASTDDSVAMVRAAFPWVTLLCSAANLGFSAGNNLALRRATGRHVLFLNPDTVLLGTALATMSGYLDAQPGVAVVGPRLRYADGREQPSRRRFPTLMTGIMESTLLEQWYPNNRWVRAYRLQDVSADHTQDVDWVNGACMLVRREALDRVGPFDEGFFMYSEELDLCRRMRADGWRVSYLPAAEVIHHEGQSSGQVGARRQILFDSSKVRYMRKYGGALRAEVLRAVLLGTYVARLAEEGLKYVLGHKRALRRERVGAYLRIIGSGLRAPKRAMPHG